MQLSTPTPSVPLSLTFRLSYSANLTWLLCLSLSLTSTSFSFPGLLLLFILLHIGLFHSPLSKYWLPYFQASDGFYRLLLFAWFTNGLCLILTAGNARFMGESGFGMAILLLGILAFAQLCLIVAIFSPLFRLLRLSIRALIRRDPPVS